MLVTYKENYRFFSFKSAICQLGALCLFTFVQYYDMVVISRDAVLGSLV